MEWMAAVCWCGSHSSPSLSRSQSCQWQRQWPTGGLAEAKFLSVHFISLYTGLSLHSGLKKAEGQINDPFFEKYSSVTPQLLPRLGPLRMALSADKGHGLASYLASGTAMNQGNPWVCSARPGGPRTPSKTSESRIL